MARTIVFIILFIAISSEVINSHPLFVTPSTNVTHHRKILKTWDIIVYGATPSGILASVSAADEGSSVLLLDPRGHIGGMMTGGLSVSDVGSTTEVIGGRTLQFFIDVGQIYGKPNGVPEWNFEPKVASKIFQKMLGSQAPNLTLQMHTRLISIQKSSNRILSASDSTGQVYFAKVWIDCSYEGYLLPLAGVSHTYGREASSEYSESVAG